MKSPENLQRAREAYLRSTNLPQSSELRLKERLRADLAEPGRARWLIGTALALAALVVLVVGRLEWLPREGVPTVTLPIDDVSLSFAGEGRIGGTERSPVIDWESGKLTVAVTPDRGVDLTVSTPEAVVRVVGTAFTVDRAEKATHVEVQRGTVRVTCAGESEVSVHGGGALTCQPADLESRVERAITLGQKGGPPEERLAAIDAALALAGTADGLVAELLAHRVRALADAGRAAEAVTTAEHALSMPSSARRAELADYVARTTFLRDGCEAQGALERAVATDRETPAGLLLAACLLQKDPSRAQQLLVACRPRATGDLALLAERLEVQLGGARP